MELRGLIPTIAAILDHERGAHADKHDDQLAIQPAEVAAPTSSLLRIGH